MYKIEQNYIDYQNNPFTNFGSDWALVTAGNLENYNTMTVSWGEIGTLWSRPVCTVFVKPCRYTYNFTEANDYFTVSFFGKEYQKDLAYLGSHSGKDEDKVAHTTLTAIQLDNGVAFKQAKTTLVCRKIYYDDLKLEHMEKEVIDHYYTIEAPHRVYVGEVVQIIQ